MKWISLTCFPLYLYSLHKDTKFLSHEKEFLYILLGDLILFYGYQLSSFVFFLFKLVNCQDRKDDYKQQRKLCQCVRPEITNQCLESQLSINRKEQKSKPTDEEQLRIPNFPLLQLYFAVLFLWL